MRAALLAIGLILMLAGIKVTTPNSQVAASSMISDQEIETKKSLYLGWACLVGGVVAIAAGVRYGGWFIPTPKKTEDQGGDTASGWL